MSKNITQGTGRSSEMIDPIEIRKAIKKGQLKVYIARNQTTGKDGVYLADILPNGEQGDTVMLRELERSSE